MPTPTLRAGMVGLGMIFDETYRPFFERALARGASTSGGFGDVHRCRWRPWLRKTGQAGGGIQVPRNAGKDRPHSSVQELRRCTDAVEQMLAEGVDFACVATPDNRHFEASKAGSSKAGVHLLVEKPSVLLVAGTG